MSLSLSQAAWLTNSVQLGFVISALVVSLLSLLDIHKSPTIIEISARFAGIANAFLILEPGVTLSLLSRFITGMALAGIYPAVLKFIATWFKKGRSFAMGIMLSAVTLGSALLPLISAFGVQFEWKLVIVMSSLSCLIASVLFALCYTTNPINFPRLRQI